MEEYGQLFVLWIKHVLLGKSILSRLSYYIMSFLCDFEMTLHAST